MRDNRFALASFDLTAADEATYRAMYALSVRLQQERTPQDPPLSLAAMVADWQNVPSFARFFCWAVWDEAHERMLARADLAVFDMASNQHAGQFRIGVDPDYRRQGLGRALLAAVADATAATGRRLLITDTTEQVPAGAAFMTRIGATPGMSSHTNQLDLAELDHELLARWQAQGRERAAGFELLLWRNEYPAGELPAFTELVAVMNQAPIDDLDVEDFVMTPDHVQQMLASVLVSGHQVRTMVAREQASGKFAGFTEVHWHPDRPGLLYQGNTGVLEAYRGRGLGRWLKAAMLREVLQEWPELRYVRTGNADSNAAMLKINYELGFKPYRSQTIWQVGLAQVQAYLAGDAGRSA
ncbi:MAG: GNAT family N-acetyltransferase [Ardenticatenaceae bacterium]|nr:GNAT family N-acetyltransferase [Anaerolineales bacterium]MCB8918343.1 GNAT family N-acetyltransferase [Ardenticatenaceae bacterium]